MVSPITHKQTNAQSTHVDVVPVELLLLLLLVVVGIVELVSVGRSETERVGGGGRAGRFTYAARTAFEALNP